MEKAKKVAKILPPDPIKIRLRQALDSSEVTQASIAKHFEITVQAVSEWFNLKKPGKCEPDRYPDLCNLLSVSIVWVLSGNGPREGSTMSDEAFDLLRRYQLLQPDQRDMISSAIDGLLTKRPAPQRFRTG